MARILVHVTVGPDDPTKAALAFLVAKSIVDEGHHLALFVAGDAVSLLTAEIAATTQGLGTGLLSDHFAALNASAGMEVYFSGMSAKARNIKAEQIVLRGATAAMPTKLVQLVADYDRVIVY